MKLESEFYRLPYLFDVEKLREEAEQFSEAEWCPHPAGIPGNASIPLVTVNGTINDDFNGPMKTTPLLERCPYIKQAIASFGEVIGRSRLMRLAAGHEVTKHSDTQYHWYSRVRIHIPITTFDDVIFYCGDKQVHMAAGECWIFDAWRPHNVINRNSQHRIHLVVDTAGSAKFWDLVARSEQPVGKNPDNLIPPKTIHFEANKQPQIYTENFNAPLVMSPGEVDALLLELIHDTEASPDNRPEDAQKFRQLLDYFRFEWRKIWLLYGPGKAGWQYYQQLINQSIQINQQLNQNLVLHSNRSGACRTFYTRILQAAFNPDFASQYTP